MCEYERLWKINNIRREDTVYVFLNLFKRWKKRESMMAIIPRYVVDAKNVHNRFIGRKNLGNVVECKTNKEFNHDGIE
jgi:hypothetical protein